jgi:hypothetical protein
MGGGGDGERTGSCGGFGCGLDGGGGQRRSNSEEMVIMVMTNDGLGIGWF